MPVACWFVVSLYWRVARDPDDIHSPFHDDSTFDVIFSAWLLLCGIVDILFGIRIRVSIHWHWWRGRLLACNKYIRPTAARQCVVTYWWRVIFVLTPTTIPYWWSVDIGIGAGVLVLFNHVLLTFHSWPPSTYCVAIIHIIHDVYSSRDDILHFHFIHSWLDTFHSALFGVVRPLLPIPILFSPTPHCYICTLILLLFILGTFIYIHCGTPCWWPIIWWRGYGNDRPFIVYYVFIDVLFSDSLSQYGGHYSIPFSRRRDVLWWWCWWYSARWRDGSIHSCNKLFSHWPCILIPLHWLILMLVHRQYSVTICLIISRDMTLVILIDLR